jgi:serine protease Do
MSKSFRPFGAALLAVASAVTGILACANSSTAAGTPALPKITTDDTPIERDARAGTSYAPVIKRVAPSVVNIYSTRTIHERAFNPFQGDPFFRRFFGPGRDDSGQDQHTERTEDLGSGVIVSADGYILTANHVVEGADEIKVALADGRKEFAAKVIGTDPPTDVAVLKVDAKNLSPITLADSDKLEVGDVVLAVGDPFGVGQTVTMGIVSGMGRNSLGISDYENFIQTDAAINPGNSGGALVDAEGRLVGINTAILSDTGGNQGVGLAVPISLARNVMDRLIKDGKVTRGYIGVRLQPEITADLASELSLPDQNGAMITDVVPRSPAARAGLQAGDVVREVDGKPVTDRSAFRLLISETSPGTKVNLTVWREGKQVAVSLRTEELTAARGRGFRNRPNQEQAPAKQDALDGVEVTDLDGSTRRELNIPADIHGALVSSVDDNSAAAAAGLERGDVLMEIARKAIQTADDAVEVSKGVTGSHVLLRVWRQGGSLYMVVDNSAKK